MPPGAQHRTAAELLEVNHRFYDSLWSGVPLMEAARFNTWPLVSGLVAEKLRRLEVAPGLRPRLPINGTQFVDMSTPALRLLRRRGASVTRGSVTRLPFADGGFDLVCALDIIEHVDDDVSAWAEIARVAAQGAVLLLSVPLHPARWTPFDDFVGHKRRYQPAELAARLGEHGLSVEQSAVFGMQPRSSRLVDAGMWWLTHHRTWALWWYNRVFMPISMHFQSKLVLVPGMIDVAQVDEVFLVCRKERSI